MYAAFFGFQREPFSIAPDPRFLFMSERHREALAHLLYGVGGGGGFVLLTGEIGAGKTTVGRCFLEQLPPHCAVAYIFNPQLSVAELLQTVCAEFGITLPEAGHGSLKRHVDALNRFLLQGHAQGRQALLVIDEAQSLSPEVLEQLRLLTNLETAERKLLQIVLIGQPELRDMLARPGLEQLAQRVIARYHLGPLSRAETHQYVAHRLSVAGAAMPFDTAAVDALHAKSGGVPRRINLLADRALLGAYAQGRPRVDRRTVAQAAQEVFGGNPVGAPTAGRLWPWVAGGSALVAVSALSLAAWAWQRAPWPLLQAAPAASAAAGRPDAAASAVAALGAAPASAAAALGAPAADDPAVGAPPPAAGVAAVATPPPAENGAASLLAAAHAEESTAWRELALHWGVAIGEGDPCQVAAQASLACYRQAQGGLAALRQLARPAILVLRGERGERAHALLLGLEEQQAALQVGARRWRLELPALAGLWRGEFATFWRTPPGWRDGADAASLPAARAWLVQQLGGDAAPTPAALRQQVAAFQVLQGLPPDGVAGPLTLMQLNRSAGLDEPRLEPATGR